MARTVAQAMNLGQPVVVENQAGAAATISAATVAKAPPDGHTLLLVSQSVLTVAPILNRAQDRARGVVATDPLEAVGDLTLPLTVDNDDQVEHPGGRERPVLSVSFTQ